MAAKIYDNPAQILTVNSGVNDGAELTIRNKAVLQADIDGVQAIGSVSLSPDGSALPGVALSGNQIEIETSDTNGVIEVSDSQSDLSVNVGVDNPGASPTYHSASTSAAQYTVTSNTAFEWAYASGAGKAAGDPIAWVTLMSLAMATGNLNVLGDVICENLDVGDIDASSVDATVDITAPEVNISQADGNRALLRTTALQVTTGAAAYQHNCINEGTTVANHYVVRGNDGGYWRWDAKCSGVLVTSVFQVGDNTSDRVRVNATGTSTGDLIVRGGTATHLLFTDASTDRVGVNQNVPIYTLDVNGDARADAHVYTPITSGSAPNNSTFVDSADNRLKFKSNLGALTILA